jgi:hypothetical protein
MILENERINCAWPGQNDLENFLFSRISSLQQFLRRFTENRTSYLALNNSPTLEQGIMASYDRKSNDWNGMDSNPFSNVS